MTNRLRALMAGSSPFAMIAREGEGGGTGGGAAPAAAPSSATILFPDDAPKADGEKKPDPAAPDPNKPDPNKPAGEGDEKPAGEWKEYVPDPAKSAEENAAAKAEHDKTKPAEKPADDPADKVPEDGKYTLTMPDGVDIDQELLDAVGPDFKELNLTNRQAQKLADRFIKVQTDRAEKQMADWTNRVAKWADDARADSEIGGAKWDATTRAATRAINQLGTPALREYLNASGGGNHPELIRLMAKVGAMIREDDPATGGAEGRGKPVDPAHLLFPNDAPKG